VRLRLLAIGAVALAVGCAPRSSPPAAPGPAPHAAAAAVAPIGAPRLEPPLAAADRGALAAEIDPFFAAPGLRTAVWSVLVQSLDSGEVLYRLNPDTLVVPASNQKIVSTAVAAARLGWDFRFETRLETGASIDDGLLRGDLFVAGNGDPTINARDGRREAFFDEMAAALRAAGITRIGGRLVGDDNAWDDERFGFGWEWDDFAFGYSAPIGPLQVNENVAEVVVVPGSDAGTPAAVACRQPGSDLIIVNRVTTGPEHSEARVQLERLPGQRELRVHGTVPLGGKEVVRNAAVDNPTRYFVAETRLALAARGIAVDGAAVDIDDLAAAMLTASDDAPRERATAPPRDGSDSATRPSTPRAAAGLAGPGQRRILARLLSPPLSEVARPLMKVSQNLYAETVMRALSLGSAPASMDASRKAAEDTLSRWGVAPGTYFVADGSGLSRHNLVSASMIVAILRAVARNPTLSEAFVATLPVAGQDGTTAGRMKGTRAEANVRAKTGTIMNVRSLSGYLTTTTGERLVFSAIANNFTTPSATVDAAVEAALERLISRGSPAR
jgi:D-alanyl-D-alanine carboxypeptidase/D-alanyl-D-alanine-endopeptidase (penicillin-binding protein 4)